MGTATAGWGEEWKGTERKRKRKRKRVAAILLAAVASNFFSGRSASSDFDPAIFPSAATASNSVLAAPCRLTSILQTFSPATAASAVYSRQSEEGPEGRAPRSSDGSKPPTTRLLSAPTNRSSILSR